jgi:lauroyl/myristoyl acyltransferase
MLATTVSKGRAIANCGVPTACLRLNRKVAATRRIYEYAELDGGIGPEKLDALTMKNAGFTLSYYQRLALLGSSRYRHHLYPRVDGWGIDRLLEAHCRRGVVLVSCHMGDFDLAGAWLSEIVGITPVVIAEATGVLRHHLFDQARHACGVVLRRPEHTDVRVLTRDIECGRSVLVMVDRTTQGRSEHLTFLGRDIAAPKIALTLATATGAALIGGATWRTDAGRIVVWAGSEIPAEYVGIKGRAAYQAVADDLTAVVRTTPHQFHVPADVRQMSWT